MPERDPNEGHRKRLREHFLKSGASGFSDHELLELLLTFAIPRRDVKPIAKDLMAKCGDLAGVLGAPLDIVRQVSGIGDAACVLVRLAAAILPESQRPERRQKRRSAQTVEDAVESVRSLLHGSREEQLHILLLDAQNRVMATEVVASGTADRFTVYPRQILEVALVHRAAAFILAHNHPSGEAAPSEADRELTKRIAAAAESVGVRLVDHLVLGQHSMYSFREREQELWRAEGRQ